MSAQFDSHDQSRLGVFVQSPLLSRGAIPAKITNQPANQTVNQGQSVTFNVTAIGTSTLTYQWQRSDNGGVSWINVGTNQNSFTVSNTVAANDNGDRYRCIVSNDWGTDVSNSAALTVIASDLPKPIYFDGYGNYLRRDRPYGTLLSEQMTGAGNIIAGKKRETSTTIQRIRGGFGQNLFTGSKSIPNATISSAILTVKPALIFTSEAFDVNFYLIQADTSAGNLSLADFRNPPWLGLVGSVDSATLNANLNIEITVALNVALFNAYHGLYFCLIAATSQELNQSGNNTDARVEFGLLPSTSNTARGKLVFS